MAAEISICSRAEYLHKAENIYSLAFYGKNLSTSNLEFNFMLLIFKYMPYLDNYKLNSFFPPLFPEHLHHSWIHNLFC